MHMRLRQSIFCLWFLTSLMIGDAQAHFLWIAVEHPTNHGPSRAVVFFGEGPQDRTYHLPESLAHPRVVHRQGGQSRVLALQAVDDEALVGLRTAEALSRSGVLETTCEYGVYHGTLLTYHARSYLSSSPTEWQDCGPSADLSLDAVVTSTDEAGAIRLRVLWRGEPLPKARVTHIHPDGESAELLTDAQGSVEVTVGTDAEAAFLIKHVEPERSGTLPGGEDYTSATHYLTVTLPSSLEQSASDHSRSAPSQDRAPGRARLGQGPELPLLPRGIASFGAAVAGDWLYVYGGHTGRRHQHSRDNLSQQFVRISLSDPESWEQLPMGTPLQGLALVAHAGRIYRIGGLTATNRQGEEEQLYSSTEFACFDPATRTWTDLPPLPKGRSSHDAVVIGDVLYVVGGWCLTGSEQKSEWHTHSLALDLSRQPLEWKEVTRQPFLRRALAVGHLRGEVVAVGGINVDGEVSRSVDIFTPGTGRWRPAAPLPGWGLNGFGGSAWQLQDVLYVSGSNGKLYGLREASQEWFTVCELRQPRFFHRLVPMNENVLLAIAGASREGHLRSLETILLAESRGGTRP